MDDMEILDSTANVAVVRLPERSFPGLVMQGDSLATLVADLRHIDADLADGSIARAHFDLREVLARMESLRLHYEAVLDEHGIQLPYSLPPQ
jgi:hypothetical protein